ncbi:hypothetical protein [Amorphus sp. 3PC139-8]|uniref:hypothetical protein n=1 Tax=Amorphus sp. 3PC139-8 TaxID=2735676 RepID=UPI00345DCEAB
MNVPSAPLPSERRFLDLVSAAEVVEDPCPHLFLDGLFSDNELQALYDHLPDETLFQDVGSGLHTFQTWREADDLDKLDARQSAYFQRLEQELFTPQVANAFYQKFRPSRERLFDHLFGETAATRLTEIELADWSMAGALNIRDQSSELPIHLDWPNRLISIVVYLAPEDGWREDWGTRLYEVRRDLSPADALGLMARTKPQELISVDTEQYRTIDFRPGRVTAFMNTAWSHHGAAIEPTAGSHARRWCLVKGLNLTLGATEAIFGLPPELR